MCGEIFLHIIITFYKFPLFYGRTEEKQTYCLGRVKNFKFKDLRLESMSYCFKSPQPKFQAEISSTIAILVKNRSKVFIVLKGKSKGC
jgi:hypothetical protein